MPRTTLIPHARVNQGFPDRAIEQSPVGNGFLSELRAHLAGMVTDFRRVRHFGAVLKTEVAQDIAADIADQQGRAGRLAYTAEQAALEAVRLLRAAQDPASEGGRNITPREAAPIFRCITRAAERDRQITEVLA